MTELVRIVLVEWVDACGPADLHTNELLPPPVAQTVGWLVYNSPEYVTVAAEVFPDLYRACTTIPRGCIVRMRDLHE